MISLAHVYPPVPSPSPLVDFSPCPSPSLSNLCSCTNCKMNRQPKKRTLTPSLKRKARKREKNSFRGGHPVCGARLAINKQKRPDKMGVGKSSPGREHHSRASQRGKAEGAEHMVPPLTPPRSRYRSSQLPLRYFRRVHNDLSNLDLRSGQTRT